MTGARNTRNQRGTRASAPNPHKTWGCGTAERAEQKNTLSIDRKKAEEAGFSPAALLSYLKENGLIETRGRAMTCSRRVNGVRTECVCLKVDLGGENSLLEDEEF